MKFFLACGQAPAWVLGELGLRVRVRVRVRG